LYDDRLMSLLPLATWDLRRAAPRTALLAALLAAAVFAFRHVPPGLHAPGERCDSTLSISGELLLHDVDRATSQTWTVNGRMPLLGVFYGLVHNHFGDDSWRVWRLADAVLVFALVFAAGALGAGPLQGVLAALAVVLGSVTFTPTARFDWLGPDDLESGYTVLVILCGCAAVWRAAKPDLKRSLALGAALTAAFLYRSTIVFYPLLLVLLDRLAPRARRPSWRASLAVALPPFLALLPWALMNWRLERMWIPLEKGEANYLIVEGALGIVERRSFDWSAFVPAGVDDTVMRHLVWWAAGEVFRHPLRFAAAYVGRLWYVFTLFPLLCSAALVGLWRGRKEPGLRAVGVLAGYFILLHCVLAICPEYVQPAWPLLAVCASYSVTGLFRVDGDAAWRRGARAILGASLAAVVFMIALTEVLVVRYAASPERGRPLEEQYARALAASPGHAFLHLERGGLRRERGDLKGALADFEQAAKGYPECVKLGRARAWTKAALGDPAELLASSRATATSEERVLLAHGLMLAGRRAEARAQLSGDIDARCPDRGRGASAERVCAAAQAVLGQAEAMLATRPASEAARLRELVREAAPECKRLVLRSDIVDAADPAVEGLVKGPKRSPEEWALDSAGGLIGAGRFPEAEAALKKAAPLAADSAGRARLLSDWLALSRALARAGRSPAAALAAAEALARADAERHVVALAAQEASDCARAERILNALLAAKPRAVYYGDRAICLAGRGEWAGAEADLERAVSMEPGLLQFYLSLAQVRKSRGRIKEALAAAEQGLAAGKGQDDLRRRLAQSRDELARALETR
jgi:tetratricopeptide (TPR) repeat protein